MSQITGWIFDLIMKKKVRKWQQAINSPRTIQTANLKDLLAHNQSTSFGREHNFKRLAKLQGDKVWEEYQKNVPIRNYEEFLPWITKMAQGEQNQLTTDKLLMFSLTSGTSGTSKLCPVNRRFILEHHQSHLLWMYHLYKDYPSVNSGKYLSFISPAEIEKTIGGIPCGAISGRQLLDQSIPVRKRQAVPYEVFNIKNTDLRWLLLTTYALLNRDLSVITATNPSTLLLLAEKLSFQSEEIWEFINNCKENKTKFVKGNIIAKDLGKLINTKNKYKTRYQELKNIFQSDKKFLVHKIWKNLTILLTWQGGSVGFYLDKLKPYWHDIPQRCLGLRASEGTFSIPLQNNSPSGVLAVNGHILEFTPVQESPQLTPCVLLADQLEVGKQYRMIITTSAGFYRYNLDDIVEVTDYYKTTPLIKFIRRGTATLSITGEKVTETQIVETVKFLAKQFDFITGFTASLELENIPYYILALETNKIVSDITLQSLIEKFDQHLSEINIEYQQKRQDKRLGKPQLWLLEKNSYEKYRLQQIAQGKPEGQFKFQHLIPPLAQQSLSQQENSFFKHVKVIKKVNYQ